MLPSPKSGVKRHFWSISPIGVKSGFRGNFFGQNWTKIGLEVKSDKINYTQKTITNKKVL